MFILKRQDVEIYSIQHPQKDQQVPVLRYQTQTFRLISVFSAAQEEEARAFWRDLTDNRGKACVLLEEPDRYSVWGKIRLEQPEEPMRQAGELSPCCIQASLLLLQAVYIDIEDMLGARQVAAFRKELLAAFRQHQLPQADTPEAIEQLLEINPLALVQIPNWQERQLQILLQALHQIGKQHFGNANFVERAMAALQELPAQEQSTFLKWLKRSTIAELWH